MEYLDCCYMYFIKGSGTSGTTANVSLWVVPHLWTTMFCRCSLLKTTASSSVKSDSLQARHVGSGLCLFLYTVYSIKIPVNHIEFLCILAIFYLYISLHYKYIILFE